VLVGLRSKTSLGNGNGTFQAPVYYLIDINSQSSAISSGDFNGDGKTDLAIADGNGYSVNIVLGKGDGTFGAAVKYSVGGNAVFVAAGDFNADGKASDSATEFFDQPKHLISLLF
jgi:hypothetical protein